MGKELVKFDTSKFYLGKQEEFKRFATEFRLFHIKVAKEALREEQGKGFDRQPKRRIDNRWNKPVDNVLPFGKIEYYSRVAINDAVLEIAKAIQDRMFRGDTGTYLRSNIIVANGTVVARNYPELVTYLQFNDINPKKRIMFVNAAPYARKLERLGVSKGRRRLRGKVSRRDGKTYSVPNGVYQLTYRSVKRNPRVNVAGFIKFEMQTLANIGVVAQTSQKGKILRSTFASDGRPYVHPTITLIPFGEGLTGGLLQ